MVDVGVRLRPVTTGVRVPQPDLYRTRRERTCPPHGPGLSLGPDGPHGPHPAYRFGTYVSPTYSSATDRDRLVAYMGGVPYVVGNSTQSTEGPYRPYPSSTSLVCDEVAVKISRYPNVSLVSKQGQ